jgi:hypothetical protein
MTGRWLRARVVRIATRGVVVLAGYWLVLRLRQLRWGATDEEVTLRLPGDYLLADPNLTATRGITIRCPAGTVCPWIAQLGQGRGGFYSYDALENLVGCDIHSANQIVPAWQEVRVGDQVRLAPEVGLDVALVDPGHALVLHGGVPLGDTPSPYNFTWAFVLNERPDRTTRLLVRERYGYIRWWAPLLVEPVEIISFVMSQKMLRGIRDRAERQAGAAEPASEGT